jgi:hypothetical protein
VKPRFAEHIGEGLMAALVAIGLEVLDQMMQLEVTGLAGLEGSRLRVFEEDGAS